MVVKKYMLEIPAELHTILKMKSASDDTTMNSLILYAIKHMFQQQEPTDEQAKIKVE